MENKLVTTRKKVLLLGVGGVSMCQLALAYKKQGYEVMGYDAHCNENVLNLKAQGIEVANRLEKHHLLADFCVKTAAVKDTDPVVVAVKKAKILVVDRAQALGELLKNFKCVIAVAGTHGKSTTSALIYEILRVAGKKVSCHVGAQVYLPRFELGDDYVVVEACEYNKSFLSIHPNIAVVTNVEPEHLDSYGNFQNLKTAFSTFVKRAQKRFVFEENSTQFLRGLKNVSMVKLMQHESALKGEYNQKNISLAVAVCSSLGVEQDVIKSVVKAFNGVPRRFEFIGRVDKTKIYIDYAHHPTEVRAFTSTFVSEYPNSLIIFQPHTYSRTKLFLSEFVFIFANLKHCCIFKEYPARETKSAGVDAKTLYGLIKQQNLNCIYMSTAKKLKRLVGKFDAIAFVGAGDVDKVAKRLVQIGQPT